MKGERICEYCGATMRGNEPLCPQCGTYDQSLVDKADRFSVIDPKSIEELKTYCLEHGIPLAMLFHTVGEDVGEASMHGIYRDASGVTVYENSPNGAKFTVYHGDDEQRAVGMFFSHLMDACHALGIYPERMAGLSAPRIGAQEVVYTGNRGLAIVIAATAALIALILIGASIVAHIGDGYYTRDGVYYYKDGNDWFINTEYGWISYEPENGTGYPEDYAGESYDMSWPIDAFSRDIGVDGVDQDDFSQDDGLDFTDDPYVTDGEGS